VVFAMPRKSGRLGGVAGSVVKYVIVNNKLLISYLEFLRKGNIELE
jgi:hypothetical protein